MSQDITPLIKALAETNTSLEHRKKMVIDVIASASDEQMEELFARMAAENMDEETQAMAKEIRDLVKNLKRAPMKPATFVELVSMENSTSPHALVTADNGEFAYMAVYDKNAADKLKLGDRVAIDGKATMLIDKLGNNIHQWGNEARFERRLDSRRVEVTTTQDQKVVVLTAKDLMHRIESKEVNPGDTLVIASGDKIAINSLPPTDSLNFYRFLERGPIPNILVDRDIGSPPRVINQVTRHVREEMTRPELRRRFRLRPCITRLLCGVSGSGKTLAVQAIHRRIYDIMSEVTGTPPEKLPHRVFRFKTSQILSMWLGESDKNADRLFDEVEKLAKQTYTNEKGREFQLPVMVVMEEAEGMGRTRGNDHDAVYDRILTTLLQRLDPNRAGLSDQLIVFLSTTNEPHLVDPAFLRRIGGSVERFGRLDRVAFTEVLQKHVYGLPAANGGNKSQTKIWGDIMKELDQWLYSEEDQEGVLEISVSGHSPMVKYRRDFLTGALVDRSVQESSSVAWEESLNDPEAGITVGHLRHAIVQQVNSVLHQLTPQNVTHYIDLPEGSKVTNIRKLTKFEHLVASA